VAFAGGHAAGGGAARARRRPLRRPPPPPTLHSGRLTWDHRDHGRIGAS
jgi:hypothetical protein